MLAVILDSLICQEEELTLLRLLLGLDVTVELRVAGDLLAPRHQVQLGGGSDGDLMNIFQLLFQNTASDLVNLTVGH